MLNDGFQYLEQRDADNNITHEGVISKKSAFATSDNRGLYDVLAENLRWLYDNYNEANIQKVLQEITDTYNTIKADPNWGNASAATIATNAANEAKQSAENASNSATEAKTSATDASNSATEAEKSSDSAKAYSQASELSANNASASEKQAKTYADNASDSSDLAKKWAESDSSPDGLADEKSDTGLTKSSKEWAIQGKNDSQKWAESTDSPDNRTDTDSATGLTQSSKAWALQGKADSQKWAMSDDSPSDESDNDSLTGKTQSAKSWSKQAKIWAVSTDSPDGQADSDSTTGKTQSAKSWALQGKADSQKWAMSDISPDNNDDSDSLTGKTQSSKEWSKQSKKWAVSADSPDGQEDTDSSTGKSKSAKEWAIQGKLDAKSWAMSESSPDGLADDVSSTKLTQSAKLWAVQAKTDGMAWAMSDITPDDKDDADSTTGKTQSSKTWSKQAKSWAMSSSSPDGLEDTDSTTGLTQSAKAWALTSKKSEQEVIAYAKQVETNAQAVETNTQTVLDVQTNVTGIQNDIKADKNTVENYRNQTYQYYTDAQSLVNTKSNAMIYKGDVDNYSDLPTNALVGDVYNIVNADSARNVNANDKYVWTGSKWSQISSLASNTGFDISNYAKLKTAVTFAKVTAESFVGLADKATADAKGVAITSYIKSIAKSDSGLTITQGDGTATDVAINTSGGIKSITRTNDTLQFTTNDDSIIKVDIGSVASAKNAEYAKTAGLAYNANHAVYADTAENANSDANGKAITEYVSDVELLDKRKLTVTKGDSTSTEIEFQDSIINAERVNDTIDFSTIDGKKVNVSIDNINHATNADNATKATNDVNGIALTGYVKNLAINGGNIVVTQGDGVTNELTVSAAISNGVGSVSRVDDNLHIISIDGNSTSDISINDISHAVNADLAAKATNDVNGKAIVNYVSDLTVSEGTLIATKGDGTSSELVISADLNNAVKNIKRVDDNLLITALDGKSSYNVAIGDVKHATNADLATKATNDTNGEALTGYVKSISAEGATLTVSKGDGTSEQMVLSPDLSNGVGSLKRQGDNIVVTSIDGNTSYNVAIGDVAHATKADSADTAIEATKATQDSNGKAITSYITALAMNGSDLTITKGDSTTEEISLAGSAGGALGKIERKDDNLVVTSADESKSYNVSINDVSHALLADNAKSDNNGSAITSYVKSITQNTKGITVTKGDGTTTDLAISGGGGIKSVTRKSDNLVFTNSDDTQLTVSINDVSHATKADKSTEADKATNDKNGIALTSYIKGVEANSDGTELTITKGDGSSTKLTIGSSTYVDTTEPWSADTEQYTANKSLVTYDQSLYLCIVTHKPTTFEKDLNNGYWKQIDSDQTVIGSASGYSQIVKRNVTAPKTLTIAINDTPSLCLPPVECLKAGTQETNIEVKTNDYSAGDEASFTHDSGVEFTDSGLVLKTIYSVDMTIPVALGDSGYISESDEIDFDNYKTVEAVNV